MPYRDLEAFRVRIQHLTAERDALREERDRLVGALRVRRLPQTRLPAFALSIGVSAVAWAVLLIATLIHRAAEARVSIGELQIRLVVGGAVLYALGFGLAGGVHLLSRWRRSRSPADASDLVAFDATE